MNTQDYLKRINVSETREPSLEFLSELQLKHLYAIPFEDLDIPNRARISLDLEKIYNKIIPTKRGGFCYELNGLFHWLLTNLGFNVDMLSARVYNHSWKRLGPEFDHMTLLVHLKEDYLVDVGFGDSFRKPIQMPRGIVSDISGTYRVNGSNKNYAVEKLEKGMWTLLYSFTIIPRLLSDFEEMCNFQQDSPTSIFRTRMLCSKATETGRITLSDTSLTIKKGKEKIKVEIKTKEEFYKYLNEYFEIKFEE
ncbi:arylamine N-acetyltransferase [Melioribacteraceae bacterium 4301-Me]|uniref:arylamine N-acetyltransferase family protein n=1 Tax=Pyranulibacter aquaticus TaxID=3163344 RepID=UPI00359C0AF0